MDFRVDKDSEFPIYQQLKEQIRYFLLSGSLQPGTKVPTPKDLGEYLRINKNTVISAYKELEKEGMLMTKHGQGTYISDKLALYTDNPNRQSLMALVRETIEKTRDMGFTTHDLFTMVFSQTILGLDSNPDMALHGLVVECNQPDLDYFREALGKELEMQFDACLLSELQSRVNDDFVAKADFIVTSVIHIEEVKTILKDLNKEVIAINATPHIQTYMRIAQLPAGTHVGVVCGTERGACNMKNALEKAGIHNIVIDYCSAEDNEKLHELLGHVDWIITSRMAYRKLKAVAPSKVRFMEFFNELDEAGVAMIKQYLKRKLKEGQR